mmetsp:Transcript_25883/g.71090  ORF Transcript_25883/g.71090 Transcript_25883/m.71090 type:complete len:733 (+) Transcript_25883:343-2541(+)|eukprot:CAMPEP_0172359010 /NCGR_PEP_ID=MMETSP1060-20121228/3251_1 /TAXON_ID=37318 /ORGANISM="Pseudo-nitzschia pungens, Strain cf. cingulata" /LENGTH=732 /DNA_ID=CAMNT_0013080459 /DNA_START=292 /DNA_END=2490 /DNA_ORIENTATION=+
MASISESTPPSAQLLLHEMGYSIDEVFRSDDIFRVLEAPHFGKEEDFYAYLKNENAIQNDDGVSVAETCTKAIFEDDFDKYWFPPFENTKPIISAHTKVWRAGHNNDILSLVMGTEEDAKSYLVGLVVTSVTVVICFFAWMILLITLKGFGSDKVGFLSGRRAKLPPRPMEARGDSNAEAETKPTTKKPEKDSNVEEAPLTTSQKVDDGDNGNINEIPKSDDIESDPLSLSSDEKEKPTLLSTDQWDDLYATKKKEECWMRTIVLIACAVVILMAGIMAQKGVESLKSSLSDGMASITYARTLLDGAEGVVSNLANGLGDFQTDVLDILERSNTELCPNFKPEGICVPYLKKDSCDFTIQLDYEKTITFDRLDVNKTIDVSYEYSVNVSDLEDRIKDKIGLDGRLDLREVFFPSAKLVYREMIKVFAANWTFIDRVNAFADTISSVSSLASQTEEQFSAINGVFYVAVVFDVIVALLALCMIVHILANDKLPASVKCIQRRCLFPLFIACVSIAFMFALAFLVASMALSDTCYNDPSERILSIAEYYMGDGLAADYVTDLLKHWVSQCDAEPTSIEQDHAFLNQAEVTLQEFELAMEDVTDSAAEFCGTTDPDLFVDAVSTILKYLCGVIGTMIDLRKAFKCSTWMPLYYNTLHNAVCYNAIDGLWSIAATQFTTTVMACIILAFRAVFFDIEITVENHDNTKELNANISSADHTLINEEKNLDPDNAAQTN